MITLKYKFKEIKQENNQLSAIYEIDAPSRYQIAREVLQDYRDTMIAQTGVRPYPLGIAFERWLDQQQAEDLTASADKGDKTPHNDTEQQAEEEK